MGIDTDIFSYMVLMEHVKDDLEYSEIGGIYVSTEKCKNWKMVTNDWDLNPLVERANNGDHVDFYVDKVIDINVDPIKQMQPHVVIRPRHNLLATKKQVKRQFVTAHQLQQKLKNKKAKQHDSLKLPQGGTRKSPRLKNLQQVNDATVSHKSAIARRKLDLQNLPHEDETMGENDPEDTILPPPPPRTEYEVQRAIRVNRNSEVFFALNLPALSAGIKNSVERNKGKEKMHDVNEDYDPGQDDGSDGDASVGTKKEDKRELLIRRRPTTCSRANAIAKPGTEDSNEKEGTFAVPQRLRGKTRMDKVHTRSFDKGLVIGMNEYFQPIAENDGVLSELSSFLGTLAKRCVSLTYLTWCHVPKNLKNTMWNYFKARYIIPDELEKWVIESIHASWNGYKSRTKAAHYTNFENDEIRLENRPDEIPLESFKILLKYWCDESVQERAKKNSASRKSYTDTHTCGPKSFAQLQNKMKKKTPDESEPCFAEVFVERERVEGREYKTDPQIMKMKIKKINEKLSTGDASDEHVPKIGS